MFHQIYLTPHLLCLFLPLVHVFIQSGLDGFCQLLTTRNCIVKDLCSPNTPDRWQAVLVDADQHSTRDAVGEVGPVF